MGTAKATFDRAIERAEYVVRLAEGLTNRRKRGTRSDWSRSFKALMHWRHADKIERVDSKDVVLIIREGAHLGPDDFRTDAIDDLLRAGLVMCVSATDAYFHAKILRYVVSQSKKKNPPPRLINEKILVNDFLRVRKLKRGNAVLRAAIERSLS